MVDMGNLAHFSKGMGERKEALGHICLGQCLYTWENFLNWLVINIVELSREAYLHMSQCICADV
jgi:hypothetical protein